MKVKGTPRRVFLRPLASPPHRATPPQLGTYNPLPYSLDSTKEVRLRVDRIKYWLGEGAQPSERVAYLLWRAGLTPAPPVGFSPPSVPKPAAELA